jgi:decaprenylphospho-beta-D-erythro-pentofuranosid-2-ulose 2-reductase
MVRTRMTEGLAEAPMTTDPEQVGAAIVVGLRKGKSTIYAPGPLRFVMGAIKALPKPVFRRLPM